MENSIKVPKLPPTTWTVGERHRGWRLDRFLLEQIPKLSRTQIQKAIGERISVSWTPRVEPSTRVRVGGTVSAAYPRLFEVPASYQFTTLFEDDDLLAIDKPAGLVVHPTNSCRANSVIEALRRERDTMKLYLTHRLDRETSGVLLLAKSTQWARHSATAFMARAFSKTYIARVWGKPKTPEGEIRLRIGKAEKSLVAVRREIRETGEESITRFRTIREDARTTLLELFPSTGRRHQLRVHCEWLGCPIVGDPLYGKPDANYLQYILGETERERMCLHAWKLEGRVGGKSIHIEAPFPKTLGTDFAGRVGGNKARGPGILEIKTSC